jgi:protein-L-isoaspartate(D-aspartate) O-methyltransferase
MVDDLRDRSAVLTSPVEEAFRSVDRQAFLPGVPPEAVYEADRAIPTRFDRNGVPISSSSAPTIMAVMLERLACQPGSRVLEIGTGTGYNAALLAHLVGPAGLVVSIELDGDTAAAATASLARLGACVDVRVGDGWGGAPDTAPFDRVIVTAGIWDVSPGWVAQLRQGGRLVAPLWIGPGFEVAVAFVRVGRGLHSVSVDWCGFMRLRGEHAGPQVWVRVGEWMASMIDPEVEALRTLNHLLATEGHRQGVAPRPTGWFARLAVAEPGAVHLVAYDDPGRRAWGVFDPGSPGLAVVDDDGLVVWGRGPAQGRVRRWLDADPIDLAQVSIEADPIDLARGPTPEHALVLPRRDHRFVVHGLSFPTSEN